jgi:hypothetical protein
MQTEYEFDVFISYSSGDKAWVRGELLKRIEQAGLKALIDFRDFTRGAPILSRRLTLAASRGLRPSIPDRTAKDMTPPRPRRRRLRPFNSPCATALEQCSAGRSSSPGRIATTDPATSPPIPATARQFPCPSCFSALSGQYYEAARTIGWQRTRC